MINTTMWLFVLVLVCCNLLQPLHSLQQLRTASSSTSSRSHHDCLFRRKSALLHAKSVEADQGKLLEGDWDFPDPYVSYLNMCRPLTEEQRRIVQQENDIVTIAPPAPKKKASEEKNDIPKNRYIELIESTREYMKNNPEPFMLAAQELLEAKSGKPVLSNHSIPSIMRVKAKMRQMESEKLSVSLKELIIAVFIERTHSFRLYKLQDSNAAKEFETWRRSHYKRTKKDILPAAKARVIDQVCTYNLQCL